MKGSEQGMTGYEGRRWEKDVKRLERLDNARKEGKVSDSDGNRR